jgi:hypothetical protein
MGTATKRDAYAWPGGYPIVYFDGEGESLCPSCAARDDADGNPNGPLTAYIHYEGSAECCGECGELIPSAYGDFDAEPSE